MSEYPSAPGGDGWGNAESSDPSPSDQDPYASDYPWPQEGTPDGGPPRRRLRDAVAAVRRGGVALLALIAVIAWLVIRGTAPDEPPAPVTASEDPDSAADAKTTTITPTFHGQGAVWQRGIDDGNSLRLAPKGVSTIGHGKATTVEVRY